MNQHLLTVLQSVAVWALDSPARLAAALRAADSPSQRRAVAAMPAVENGVQVIHVEGVLVPKPTWIGEWFGGETPIDHLRAQVRAATANPDAKSILLVVDSPGGDVSGVPELADELLAARAIKPLRAHVRYLAASGGYWLASQAETVTAEPSAMVGGIGVFTIHQSFAKWLEDAGIETTIIRSPENKAEWNPFEPLSDEAKAHAQTRVEQTHAQFVAAVARGRGVDAETVRASYSGGQLWDADTAKKAGMIDGVMTVDAAISRAAKAGKTLRADEARRRDLDLLEL